MMKKRSAGHVVPYKASSYVFLLSDAKINFFSKAAEYAAVKVLK